MRYKLVIVHIGAGSVKFGEVPERTSGWVVIGGSEYRALLERECELVFRGKLF